MDLTDIHKIIRSKRRTVGLQVTPDARLIVRAPQKISDESLREVVRQKRSWILRKQEFARKNYFPAAPKTFTTGEQFPYLGEVYELSLVPGAYGPLTFDGKRFFLCEGCVPLAKWLFRDWYRERAAEVLSDRVRHYAALTGARYSKIGISNATGRWGSCSGRGVLNFSWRLVMAPQAVVDYVVVHEVVHLEQLNHSKKFWQKVKALAPDFLQAKRWLERNRLSLHEGAS